MQSVSLGGLVGRASGSRPGAHLAAPARYHRPEVHDPLCCPVVRDVVLGSAEVHGLGAPPALRVSERVVPVVEVAVGPGALSNFAEPRVVRPAPGEDLSHPALEATDRRQCPKPVPQAARAPSPVIRTSPPGSAARPIASSSRFCRSAGHADPRTTERYWRRKDSLDDNAVDYVRL